MVRPHNKGVLGALQPMAPLLHSKFPCQKLPVANIIIPLGRGQLARQKSTEMDLIIRSRTLRKHSTYPRIRGIHLHDELQGWISGWMRTGEVVKCSLSFWKADSASLDQQNGVLVEVRAVSGDAILL